MVFWSPNTKLMMLIDQILSFRFPFVFLLLSVLTLVCAQDYDYLYHFCYNSSSLAGNSTYRANLYHLFSSLLNASKSTSDGFYNTTAGQDPNTVYGIFLCRGDVSTEICQNCVASAANDVAQLCPTGYEAVIWYGRCIVRYSNRSIFSTVATDPKIDLKIRENVSEPDRFNQLVAGAATYIANQAANASVGAKKFATKEVKFNEFQDVYSLAQCSPDISGDGCNRCLQFAIGDLPECCSGRVAGFALYPSCILRYQVTPFYNLNEAVAPPSTPLVGHPVNPPTIGKGQTSSGSIIIVIFSTVGSLVIFSIGLCWILISKARKKKNRQLKKRNVGRKPGDQSLQFDFRIIEDATNNFADANIIGTGGFGRVYKGVCANGQEIAVKRLSRSSKQGGEEFRNEVVLLATLQHRNLVRLLGFCTDRKERMLIYEFVPNKSLDYFIFDPEKRAELDWPRRHKIIKGIALGLLYLHTDSRLRIIHRDLKASNILLDEDMTPKISDFGMARIIEENQTQEPTKRIVGTYGYILPEFAMHGKFSEKSDVFSFGVLMLEIVCGKRNAGISNPNYAENLLTYALLLFSGCGCLGLMGPPLSCCFVGYEVLMCVLIFLVFFRLDCSAFLTMALLVFLFCGGARVWRGFNLFVSG
ncbi:hypothetical protein SLEP1_g29571 [Rubroshorea leprosula]|uniref:Cysteine-rich receptor-like protein kinase 25 n=1 Tax=Rubroshorea leprosula TaxID=152421 RepID=A0AAV5JXA9_9ROSI|nr:hypothetical protein SLEP1_g29571 [Rubroshorea leprosula]